MSRDNLDWKEKLYNMKKEIEANLTPSEKRQLEKEKKEKAERQRKINERREVVYQFLAGYKQNSGIFINNFFRNRDFATYCEDKFEIFDFDISGMLPNVFNNFSYSMQMTGYLSNLEKNKIAYYPITKGFIQRLISFAEVLDLLEPLQEDIILYRGCSTLQRNGVNGVVSTTTDRAIAEQFSRGTILKLHVPKGTKYFDVRAFRPKEQRKKDLENEYILPPCKYEILSSKTVKKGREPNNWRSNTTNVIELQLEPLDLLEEFLKVMKNPPREYEIIEAEQGRDYLYALEYLQEYLNNRNRSNNMKPKR